MDLRLVVIVLASLCAVSLASPAKANRKQVLEEAFNDRATVEAIIDCFITVSKCNTEQKKIRERALATMHNLGVCPDHMCTKEERKEMTRAMELLREKHFDLWTRLIAAMIGIDLASLGA